MWHTVGIPQGSNALVEGAILGMDAHHAANSLANWQETSSSSSPPPDLLDSSDGEVVVNDVVASPMDDFSEDSADDVDEEYGPLPYFDGTAISDTEKFLTLADAAVQASPMLSDASTFTLFTFGRRGLRPGKAAQADDPPHGHDKLIQVTPSCGERGSQTDDLWS